MICPTCNVHEMVYTHSEVGPNGPFDVDSANCSGCKQQWEKCKCPEVGSIVMGPEQRVKNK